MEDFDFDSLLNSIDSMGLSPEDNVSDIADSYAQSLNDDDLNSESSALYKDSSKRVSFGTIEVNDSVSESDYTSPPEISDNEVKNVIKSLMLDSSSNLH